MSKKVWLVSFCGLSLIVACVVLSLMIASYNRVPGQKLRFETIENHFIRGSLLDDLIGEQPKLVIITSPEEARAIHPFVSRKARVALDELDYKTHFGLFFFAGIRPSPEQQGFGIRRIYRQDNQIIIQARLGRSAGLGIVHRPYHLIKVEKSENWRGSFTFALYLDETAPPVVTTTHHFAQAQERGPFSSPLPTPTTP
jgi:hypothetical protein